MVHSKVDKTMKLILDTKESRWVRQTYDLTPAQIQKYVVDGNLDVNKFLKDIGNADIEAESEEIDDTIMVMSPQENEGRSTMFLSIVTPEGKQLVYQNSDNDYSIYL